VAHVKDVWPMVREHEGEYPTWRLDLGVLGLLARAL